MRVLLISHAYIAPENLRKPELLARYPGLEIAVVASDRWKTAHGKEIKDQRSKIKNGFDIISLPVYLFGNSGRYFYQPIGLYQAIKKFKPYIIHLEEEPWTPVALEVSLLSKIVRSKLIVFTWENLDLKLSFWQRAIEKFVFKTTSLVIAGNSEAKERVRKRGFEGPIEVLPQFGVNTEHFKPLDVANLKSKLGLSGFVVGFVGRFVEEKGIGILLEAVAKLPQDVKLLLVSSSPKLPMAFEELAKNLKVYDRVKIVNGVSHQDLPKYMNLMDVLVLPSLITKTWKEQFGRVLIEAMACKLPVIGSSSGAIPEVISDAGLIFEEGNAENLKSQILNLKSDSALRQKLAEKGYQRVLKNFTFEKIAAETVGFYSACQDNVEIVKSKSIT